MHVKRDRGSFVPFTYQSIALDGGWYKVLIWHAYGMHQEPLYVVCICVSANTCKGLSRGVYISLVKFQLIIWIEASPIWVFYLFCWVHLFG